MANKTKNELLEEINKLQDEIISKEQQLIKYETISACANMGEEYKYIYDSYISAGFTEKQAFELLQITVDRTVNDFATEARRAARRCNVSYRSYNRY